MRLLVGGFLILNGSENLLQKAVNPLISENKRRQEQPKELTQTLQQTPVLPLLQAMLQAF